MAVTVQVRSGALDNHTIKKAAFYAAFFVSKIANICKHFNCSKLRLQIIYFIYSYFSYLLTSCFSIQDTQTLYQKLFQRFDEFNCCVELYKDRNTANYRDLYWFRI